MKTEDLLRGLVMAAALLGTIGALGDWGALSRVASQAEVVASTRWILVALALGAVGFAWLAGRRPVYLMGALVLLSASLVLAWTEWRYEGIQAAQRDLATTPWGLLLLLFSSALGAALSLAGYLATRRETPAPPPT